MDEKFKKEKPWRDVKEVMFCMRLYLYKNNQLKCHILREQREHCIYIEEFHSDNIKSGRDVNPQELICPISERINSYFTEIVKFHKINEFIWK